MGSFVFGTRIIPDVLQVTIISSLSGDTGASGTFQQSASGTGNPSEVRLIPPDHQASGQDLVSKPVVQKADLPPVVLAQRESAKLKPLEEEMTHETPFKIEPMEPTGQTVTVDTQSTPQSSVGAYRDTPLPGGFFKDGGAGMGSGGPGTGSAGSGSGSGRTGSGSGGYKDALAEFLSQVRQVIEQNKQYPSLARLQGLEGTTQLRFRILPTGEPTEIQIVQSSQSAVLDEAAVATVKRSGKFPQPPVTSNRGILIRLPLVFHLEGG